MRLEELTLNPTCIRCRVALAQARRNLSPQFQTRSSTPHRVLARDSDAMTQASPLRDCERQVRYFRKSIQAHDTRFVT
jgi:hypothetical protein